MQIFGAQLAAGSIGARVRGLYPPESFRVLEESRRNAEPTFIWRNLQRNNSVLVAQPEISISAPEGRASFLHFKRIV